MWMELQGKKAAHDFLLIYNKDSRSPPLSGGFPLKTHDFLRSLEDGEAGGAEMPPSAEHVLPGGIGTYSITHVAVLPPSKLERGTCAVVRADSAEGKPEPHGIRSNGHCAARSFPQWGGDTVAKETGSTGRWPPPFAGCSGNNFGSPPSSKLHPAPEKKRFIMESAPIPVKPFPDVDDEDEEESQKVELSVKLDGKGNDQKQPSTPRSKHSATEQRRRSKINDRFQILRDLIPNSDQKRDKASFLLEVIEYIRFLQEKVQKYEAYPGWNQENAKLMPWNNQLHGDSMTDQSHFVKNVPPPGYMFSGKFDDNNIPVAPVMLSNIQNPTESELSAGVPYKTMETPGFSNKEAAVSASMHTNVYASSGKAVNFTQPQQMLNSDTDSMGYQSQSQWLRSPCPPECTVSSATLNEQEELSINEGTISVSSAYSQGLLTALTQTLQSSGIDLSQASISVQIDLGKRAIHRHIATTTMSSAKDHDDPLFRNQAIGQLRVGNSREECEQAPKRHKLDSNS